MQRLHNDEQRKYRKCVLFFSHDDNKKGDKSKRRAGRTITAK